MTDMRDRNWNFESDDDLLYSYVGSAYKNTAQDFARIAFEKAEYDAKHIARMLEIEPADRVLDIGSGYGHVAKALAPQCSSYVCVDISKRMLERCIETTAGLANVRHMIIDRASLPRLYGETFDKVFANSVFIHLNLFDISLYFEEVAKVTRPGSLFYFNVNDSDRLSLAEDPDFLSMRERYRQDPLEITLMSWTSLTAIAALAARRGFALKKTSVWRHCATSVTFERL